MSVDGDADGGDDFGDIIDQNLFKLAEKKNDEENFDWDNDDILEAKNEKRTRGTAFTRMIQAYRDLPPFWAMIVSIIYVTCFLLIFFLLDYFFFIEDNKLANWRYWKSSLFDSKGYPLFVWTIYLEIVFGSFFILRYFFIVFPNILLKLSDILLGGISEKYRHYTIDYIKYLHNYITFTVLMFVSTIAYQDIFVEKSKHKFAKTFGKILLWGFIASFIWLIEKVFFQTFAMKFHKKAFEDRINKLKYSISILDKFYKAYNNEGSNETRSPKRKKFVNRLRNIVNRNNDATLIVRNPSDAKKLARLIFEFLRTSDDTQFLVLNDFIPFFDDESQAQRAFNIFDVDRNGDISKFEIKNIIISIYKEKEAIEKSMRDSGLALRKFDGILKFIAFIIICLIGMAILTTGYSTVMISLGTIWASTMFAFSGIITTIVENIIFLFISHPFDVGDKIQVGDNVMYVTEFGLISTIFRRTDGKRAYCPNKKIASQFIKNVRRSGTIIEDIDLEISLNTTKEQIDELKRRILEFLKKHNNDFQLRAEVALKSLKDVGHINLGIMIEHNINFQDTFKYNMRRNELLLTIQSLLNDIGISLYHENSYDVKLTCANPKKLPIIAALSSNVPFN
ncbi:hypothetical protein BCR36DRAFT_348023 [Piromyces finnis]|uniref:EF-hand domain-containing protein n=1 Tax=Piromyces finnis TaxID=1754191 RepID=A0A1Y1VFI4_9FUNG|nr:hypothetical protein BCR36DRAFT_348023 [Piromyces finnis]|eukprot:ORX54864.1 hypothetical protein BCR36DRAFT_348023 [Piromyces finnis]